MRSSTDYTRFAFHVSPPPSDMNDKAWRPKAQEEEVICLSLCLSVPLFLCLSVSLNVNSCVCPTGSTRLCSAVVEAVQ